MTDTGEPGTNDTIGITFWNGNSLLFSPEWTGAKTLKKQFDGGNPAVHRMRYWGGRL
jgi:hypothetical protein